MSNTASVTPLKVADPPELLTAREAAEMLRITTKTLESYQARGVIPTVRFGTRKRFLRSEVERVMRSGF